MTSAVSAGVINRSDVVLVDSDREPRLLLLGKLALLNVLGPITGIAAAIPAAALALPAAAAAAPAALAALPAAVTAAVLAG